MNKNMHKYHQIKAAFEDLLNKKSPFDYDDALFVNADFHIKLILKEIVKNNLTIRFHCPNSLHARFIDDELAYLMKHAGFKTLRLSLETVNEQRQKETGGKVKLEDLTNAANNLKKQGVISENIDPLLTNNTVFSYLFSGYDREEFKKLKLEAKEYNISSSCITS